MSSFQTDIVEWLHSKQNWLQEAASRFLNQGIITDIDIDQLTALLKTDLGQSVTTTHLFSGFSTSTTPNTLILESISEVAEIDNLAPRNPLIFGANNLIVIYGNNGSGKSGYTRILKKATGKAYSVELKHDMFKPIPSATDRRCKIKYQLNGESYSNTWIANSPAIDHLSGVDIFDADNAKLYLTKEKEVTYTPPLILIFEELVSVCRRIEEKLEHEKQLLVSSLPILDNRYINTEVGKLYNGLKSTHTAESLSSILIFTEADEIAIKQLQERLQTEDPLVKARKIRKEKGYINQIVEQLKSAYNSINSESCKVFLELKNEAILKRKIATEAIKQNDNLSKLQGVGSDTWKALWEAARNYSTTEAYKEESFPKINEAKCVLCHQDLDLDATKRMESFENFVKSAIETDAKNAEFALKRVIEQLAKKPTEESLEQLLDYSGLDIMIWKSKLEEVWNEIIAKNKELIESENTTVIGLEASSIVLELEALSSNLENEAVVFDTDSKGFDRVKAQKELLELEAKQWTTSQNTSILAEIQRLQDINNLDTWKSLTQSRGISRKASEFSESIITDEYIERFNRELILLGANRIKVKIEKTGARAGIVKHQIKLRDSITEAPIIDILSEGEQRIISLAAFLSDVTSKTESTPFIFDDPISSLDQDFEEKTIDRLIQLSENRQVIIFTHRLSFLGIINDRASTLEQIHIRKEPWGSGEVGEIPLFGKKPEKALHNLMHNRLAIASKVYTENGTEDYYPLAKAICSDFRILLERVVELYFLADVVQRHRRAINTMGKIGNLVKITKDDCALIDTYMTKYSVYEHSQSSELPSNIPEPNELGQDINAILTWYDDFKGR